MALLQRSAYLLLVLSHSPVAIHQDPAQHHVRRKSTLSPPSSHPELVKRKKADGMKHASKQEPLVPVVPETVAEGVSLTTAHVAAAFTAGITLGIVSSVVLFTVLANDKTLLANDKRPQIVRSGSGDTDDECFSARTNDSCTTKMESIHLFFPRCSFLVAMLIVQSLSSIILAGFEDLIKTHPGIIFFLTMVVGTGGNVGGQSVVLAVRRLAYGEELSLMEQFRVGIQLSAILAPLAMLRAWAQGTSKYVSLTIAFATAFVIIGAAVLGTALPKLFHRIKLDPAHATPVIQVLMDMVGVLVTCSFGYVLTDALS